MNFTETVLKQRKILLFVLIAIVIGGIISFTKLGKLEDAEIPVKSALIITHYPGASPHEMELQVTDVLETAVQSMDDINNIESRSLAGYSEIIVNIKQHVKTDELPQVWDVLRRKVNDITIQLPANAHAPMIFDDFGDVYGIFLAISSEEFDYEELQDYSSFIRRELLLIDGVKRINIFGEPQLCVNIELSQEKMANLGIHPQQVANILNKQNKIANSGSLKIGEDRIRITPKGNFWTLKDLEKLCISGTGKNSVFLKDIAEVSKGQMEPYVHKMKYNKTPALGLSIAIKSGGDIIDLGERVQNRMDELKSSVPIGINISKVFYQPERVNEAIGQFMINLIGSVLIVVMVLLLTMGLRTGLLIGSGLIFAILGTFIVMLQMDIILQRISLAAIIVAMGMLVDNSIVIADGILIDLKRGIPKSEALLRTARKTALPLLGATIVAILAFLPIGLSPDSTGEFCISLFQVVAISLFLSWLLAITQTPYFCDIFLKGKKYIGSKEDKSDPFDGKFYRFFRTIIKYSLRHKTMVIGVTITLFFSSIFLFQFVEKLFFPNLEYNQLLVEYYLPEGSDIKSVERDLDKLEDYLLEQNEIFNVTTSLGATPARYTFLRPFNMTSQNYGEIIADTENYDAALEYGPKLQAYLDQNFPQATVRVRYYSPISTEYQIEAKFSGPDPEILRILADEAQKIMEAEPSAIKATNNWKNKVKIINPVFSQTHSRMTHISKQEVCNALVCATNGFPIGVLNQGEDAFPILLKMNPNEENYIEALENTPVWGSIGSVPLRRLVSNMNIEFEDPIIRRYNRRRAIKAQCDPADGYQAPQVKAKIQAKIDAIPLPVGYDLQWLGEYKQSKDANEAVGLYLPVAFILMIIVIIMMFNNFRQPVIILILLPLAFIGVSLGLLITGKPFGFMPMLGTLGLMGMMIKNAVVLLDQINLEISQGKEALLAVVDSVVSRMRPVIMASFTTILGMIPLIGDALFGGMAVAIMFGLLVGSIITLIVVPVLYAVFYRISTKNIMNL